MILDITPVTAPRPTTFPLPEQTRPLCILHLETQDTIHELLSALHAQEYPILLQLPADGACFTQAEHFVQFTQFLTEQAVLPFVCLIIPEHRRAVALLADTYGIQHAASLEEAASLFEHEVLTGKTSDAHPLRLAQVESPPTTRSEEQQQGETSVLPWTPRASVPAHVRRVTLLFIGSVLFLPLMLWFPTHTPSSPPELAPVGTFAFESSGQFNPTLTQGYNDRVSLSLRTLPPPPRGFAYDAWFIPDPTNASMAPLFLGSLHPGSNTLVYTSPGHTNLLASYSGIRVTLQPAVRPSETPSLDSRMWKWQGFFPNEPMPGDEHHYSLLSHLRHLLAQDPTLQANLLPGGLVLWLTRNTAKINEWAGSAQSDWHGRQTSSGDADQLHRQLLRILEYLDGISYYERDVPAGSPWIVDPSAGKIGLLDRVPNQQPPAFLVHVGVHLIGLTNAPGHTIQQQRLAVLITTVISRMQADLSRIRQDANALVTMNTQQLRQQRNQAPLDDLMNLAGELQSGWFDPQTGENIGGVLWMTSRLQQLASAPIF